MPRATAAQASLRVSRTWSQCPMPWHYELTLWPPPAPPGGDALPYEEALGDAALSEAETLLEGGFYEARGFTAVPSLNQWTSAEIDPE